MTGTAKPSSGVTYNLKIGTYEIHSTKPIEPCDLRSIPCSLQNLRAYMATEIGASRDVSSLKPLLDTWNANPGLHLHQVLDLLGC